MALRNSEDRALCPARNLSPLPMTEVARRALVASVFAILLCPPLVGAQPTPWADVIDTRAAEIEPQVIEWRRTIHANPELSNRETRTATMVATHLRGLGLEVETGVARTGVVAVLEGDAPGPVVALRADMDALPIKERTDVPFASTDSARYNGKRVPVMHACGHDAHVAMLMGAAEILASIRDQLSGTVKFLFQPAEEGAPDGERGGADVMVDEGALEDPDVDAIIGLHIRSKTEVGTIRYRSGPMMAASDVFHITVRGKQTHAATPWEGVDPIVPAARIIRELDSLGNRPAATPEAAAVVSSGTFDAGVRNNIIPETAQLTGTIRTFDPERRRSVHRRVRRIAGSVAEEAGTTVDVDIHRGYPVTRNDSGLTNTLAPALKHVADSLVTTDPVMGAEDFSYFSREVPGLYVFVGGMSPDVDPADAPSHHTPTFFIDERGLRYGVRTYAQAAAEYLATGAQ